MKFFKDNKYVIGISCTSIVLGTIIVVVGAPLVGTLFIVGGIAGTGYLAYKVYRGRY